MQNENSTDESTPVVQNEDGSDTPGKKSLLSRREFVGMTAISAAGFTILPRYVLGGKGFVAPSDTISLAYIGVGSQGTRELCDMLQVPRIRVVAVCDPNKKARGYRDWGPTDLRDQIRETIQDPNWTPGGDHLIPGGRDNAKEVIDTYYKNVAKLDQYNGCKAYANVHELFDKEKGIDAVKIMTPDHLHGILCIAAMKRGKNVLVHKPISNRLLEGKKVIEMARNKPNLITHLIPWDSNGDMTPVMNWINAGAIGTLTEIHNWTNRPVWPQYDQLPTDKPPIPDGFDWDLWLGPEAERDYSPDYTNMVFRGWYDFGGGSMADMGHYSLWTVFDALHLTSPEVVEPRRSHVCTFNGAIPFRIDNDFSFPTACTVRYGYPANGDRPPVELFWYDGGMRPPTPDELAAQNQILPEEGLMFVGTKGKILAGFNVQNPQLLVDGKIESSITVPASQGEAQTIIKALGLFVDAIKNGKQYPGNFSDAEFLTEAIDLYAVALRANQLLKYDASTRTITNAPDGNKYLSRNYRPGWDPDTI